MSSFWILLSLVVVMCLTGAHAAPAPKIDWNAIPVPKLAWKACWFDPDFQCANVTAPLDYDMPKGRTIRLAAIKAPATAKNPADKIGTLFINPGGPGGPATGELPAWIKYYPAAIRKAFDIVGWDPRGIGQSTAVQCFDTQAQYYKFLGQQASVDNVTIIDNYFPLSKKAADNWIKLQEAYGKQCAKRNGDLLRFVSTADVARDMELLRRAVGDAKLSYWGLSYGSMVGQTYANMFPNNFRALIVDGCLDPTDWYAKPGLGLNLRVKGDLAPAAVFEMFLQECSKASKTNCQFSEGSYQATRTKWTKLVQRVEKGPIALDLGPGKRYNFGLQDVVAEINSKLIEVTAWAGFGTLLQTLWNNRNLPLLKQTTGPDLTPGPFYTGSEQAQAVQCGDIAGVRDPTYFWDTARKERARAGYVSQAWTWGDAPCLNWPTAKHPYPGPWNVPTKQTVLVIGNTGDPSTYYYNSVAISSGVLGNARLLTLDGYGHTSLLNFSECINKLVTDYLLTGKLPPQGTVCPQSCVPFTNNFNNCTADWKP